MAKKKIKKTKKTEILPIGHNPPPPKGVEPPDPPPGPPKITTDGVKILHDRFISDAPERLTAIEYEKKLAESEQQVYDLTKLLQKRDKEIETLTEELNTIKNARHYGAFS